MGGADRTANRARPHLETWTDRDGLGPRASDLPGGLNRERHCATRTSNLKQLDWRSERGAY